VRWVGGDDFNAAIRSPTALIARDEFRALAGSVPISHWAEQRRVEKRRVRRLRVRKVPRERVSQSVSQIMSERDSSATNLTASQAIIKLNKMTETCATH
jgi:hypothetical protein